MSRKPMHENMIEAIRGNQAYLDTILLNAHTEHPIDNPSVEAVYTWLEDELDIPFVDDPAFDRLCRALFSHACEIIIEEATPADWQRIQSERKQRNI